MVEPNTHVDNTATHLHHTLTQSQHAPKGLLHRSWSSRTQLAKSKRWQSVAVVHIYIYICVRVQIYIYKYMYVQKVAVSGCRTYIYMCVCIYMLDMRNVCPLESISRCVCVCTHTDGTCVHIPIVFVNIYPLCVCVCIYRFGMHNECALESMSKFVCVSHTFACALKTTSRSADFQMSRQTRGS